MTRTNGMWGLLGEAGLERGVGVNSERCDWPSGWFTLCSVHDMNGLNCS